MKLQNYVLSRFNKYWSKVPDAVKLMVVYSDKGLGTLTLFKNDKELGYITLTPVSIDILIEDLADLKEKMLFEQYGCTTKRPCERDDCERCELWLEYKRLVKIHGDLLVNKVNEARKLKRKK